MIFFTLFSIVAVVIMISTRIRRLLLENAVHDGTIQFMNENRRIINKCDIVAFVSFRIFSFMFFCLYQFGCRFTLELLFFYQR